ncbi:MAG TPA: nucleotide exchange factor GrpE, partial [Planctomycetota bacterium]
MATRSEKSRRPEPEPEPESEAPAPAAGDADADAGCQAGQQDTMEQWRDRALRAQADLVNVRRRAD